VPEKGYIMLDAPVSVNGWDGQLPSNIVRSLQIWWEVFPNIKTSLPPKIFWFLGGAVKSPSRETMGKVICIADTKAMLRQRLGESAGSLLNQWDCYCQKRMEEQQTVYVAGTKTETHLTLQVQAKPILVASMKFVKIVSPALLNALQKLEQSLINDIKELDKGHDQQESEVAVLKFKQGRWENGLDMTFRAAIWVRANPEEALARIWNIQLD
jgi:hypothetical protein